MSRPQEQCKGDWLACPIRSGFPCVRPECAMRERPKPNRRPEPKKGT